MPDSSIRRKIGDEKNAMAWEIVERVFDGSFDVHFNWLVKALLERARRMHGGGIGL